MHVTTEIEAAERTVLLFQAKASECFEPADDDYCNDGNDLDEEEDIDIGTKQRKKLISSFHRLRTWYENQYSVAKPVPGLVSPRKSFAKKVDPEHDRPPLIVIFEDFEAFPSNVLQKFILNIK